MDPAITELTVRKVGNSAGVILPQSLLKAMDLDVGARLKAEVEDGRVTLTPAPAKKRYSLAELLGQCKPRARMPAELKAWDSAGPAGRELL